MKREDRELLREIACMVGSLWFLTAKAYLALNGGQSPAGVKEFGEQGEKALATFWEATGGDGERVGGLSWEG